jgi:peptidoglycan/LPS O-acetylase OafA/YrhL
MSKRSSSTSGHMVTQAIDGLRSLMNIWVVACHVTGLLTYFIFFTKDENENQKREFLASKWPDFAIGFGYQVDVFFVISGFLLTWNFFKRFSKKEKTDDAMETAVGHQNQITTSNLSVYQENLKLKDTNLFKETFLFALKRLFRFWPGTLGAILLSMILGDYLINDFKVVLSLFTYPISRELPMAFGVSWSNRLDFICSCIVYTVCYLFEKYSLWSFTSCLSLVFLSFLPKLIRFLTLIPRPSYLKLKQAGVELIIPMYMFQQRLEYHQTVLYPEKFHPVDIPLLDSEIKKWVMKNEYMIFHQRITPFFIGMMLAYVLSQQYSQQSKQNSQKTTLVYRIFHSVMLLFAFVFAFQPLLIGCFAPKVSLEQFYLKKVLFTDPDPPLLPDLFISCLNRPLYASAFAYLLYRTMLPTDHFLSLPFLKRFLELPIFSFLSRYSYGIYSVHYKVMMEVMWNYFPPKTFINKSILFWFLYCFLICYLVSLMIAIGIYYFIEKPSQKYLFQPLLMRLNKELEKGNVKEKSKEL